VKGRFIFVREIDLNQSIAHHCRIAVGATHPLTPTVSPFRGPKHSRSDSHCFLTSCAMASLISNVWLKLTYILQVSIFRTPSFLVSLSFLEQNPFPNVAYQVRGACTADSRACARCSGIGTMYEFAPRSLRDIANHNLQTVITRYLSFSPPRGLIG